MIIEQPVLSPIRFYKPSLEFNNEENFQNPDNRVSTGYDFRGVKALPYHLPIPKQWPDGQPGIDCMINMVSASSINDIYVKLYDADNAEYLDCQLSAWGSVTGPPTEIVARLYSQHGVED